MGYDESRRYRSANQKHATMRYATRFNGITRVRHPRGGPGAGRPATRRPLLRFSCTETPLGPKSLLLKRWKSAVPSNYTGSMNVSNSSAVTLWHRADRHSPHQRATNSSKSGSHKGTEKLGECRPFTNS